MTNSIAPSPELPAAPPPRALALIVIVALAIGVGSGVAASLTRHSGSSHPITATDGAIATAGGARARAQGRAAQSDLRNAIVAEKTIYTDTQQYSSTIAALKAVEPELDWGGTVTVVVGDAVNPGDAGIVCVSERSSSGAIFSLADIASGAHAGTYFGNSACPPAPTPENISAFGISW